MWLQLNLKSGCLKLGNKLVLLLATIALILFSLFASVPPQRVKRDYNLLFVNPELFRAISGNFHTLLADKFWMMSSLVSETSKGGSFNVNTDELYAATKSLIALDGNFRAPVIYAATYLTSIHKMSKEAKELLELALVYNPLDFPLYFIEVTILLTYESMNKDSLTRAIQLAELSKKVPADQRKMNIRDVDVWMQEMIEYSKDQLAKNNQKINDLIWLYKQSENEVKRDEIQKKLLEYGVRLEVKPSK